LPRSTKRSVSVEMPADRQRESIVSPSSRRRARTGDWGAGAMSVVISLIIGVHWGKGKPFLKKGSDQGGCFVKSSSSIPNNPKYLG
jgi:hypothetical protein